MWEINRSTALSRLLPGDLFYGVVPDGPTLICLVTATKANVIEARRITTQQDVRFDRTTGAELGGKGQIISVEPLPLALHAVMMGLERNMRLRAVMEIPALNEEERRGLVELASFYRAHPLPPEDISGEK